MSQLSKKEIRDITEQVVNQLGAQASPANIEQVVHTAIRKIETTNESQKRVASKASPHPSGERVIVTAFGENSIGILAGLTGVLAETSCDIVDLSQKIMGGFFTIMLLMDVASANVDYETLKSKLIVTGERFNLRVIVQHEQLFKTMHRI